jgi:thiol-disulfide isomerase/thioredoxin
MRWRHGLLIIGAALMAGGLGLLVSLALYGPGPLLSSRLGQRLLQHGPASAEPTGSRIAELGEPMPPLQLFDLAGRSHTLPRPGRAVLINYWASWCGPCREEMPLLAEYSRSARARDPEIIGIALDSPESAQEFLTAYPVPFTILIEAPYEHDSSERVGNRRDVLPFTVLVGADGRLIKRRYGAFDSGEELSEWAAEAR